MNKSDSKRLSTDQKKELMSVFKSLGISPSVGQGLLNSQHRRKIYDSYKIRRDYSFTYQGQVVRLSFSECSPRSLADLAQSSVREPIKELDKPVIQEKRKGRGKGKTPVKKVTSVALEPELLDQLKEKAEQEERSIGSLIRIAVKQYLKGGFDE
jgi:hypothetical protein